MAGEMDKAKRRRKEVAEPGGAPGATKEKPETMRQRLEPDSDERMHPEAGDREDDEGQAR